MNYILDHEGKPYNKYFEEICSIPHASYKEEKIANYLVEFAKQRGLWHYVDEIWNVIIKKPASQGYENHPPVMLQAHTDMVCVKSEGSSFNFDTDPLQLYVEDGWLMAKDTTLGADCGHGVAYMLSILDDLTLNHPPLECFFSVQEETGIGGPKHVNYNLFSAKKLINTDMMVEGGTVLSTAYVYGGYYKRSYTMQENSKPTYKLIVGGGRGGHGAADIGWDYANAIKLVVQILCALERQFPFHLASMAGGTAINNLPAYCEAAIVFTDVEFEKVKEIVTREGKEIKETYAFSDPDLYIEFEEDQTAQRVFSLEESCRLLHCLLLLPSGVYLRRFPLTGLQYFTPNPPISGDVISSRHLGTLSLKEGGLSFGYNHRSNLESMLKDMHHQTNILLQEMSMDMTFEVVNHYAGYRIEKTSPLIRLFEEVYQNETGKELQYFSTHGGTDVGEIMRGMGSMDVITVAPDTKNIHRPGEALNLLSFERTYGYLIKILQQL